MKNTLLATTLLIGLATSAQAQNFYIGTAFGVGVGDTSAVVGGQKQVDIGGDNAEIGLRFGVYTPRQIGWFAGLELEAAVMSGRSRSVINGDVFNYQINQTYGAYARLGASNGNASIYLRPGVVYLDTSLGNTAAPSVGVGIEIRFSNNVAARLDVDYTWYNASWAVAPVENYRMRFGIGYYFSL